MNNRATMEVSYIQYKANNSSTIRNCKEFCGNQWAGRIGDRKHYVLVPSMLKLNDGDYITKNALGMITVIPGKQFFDLCNPIARQVSGIPDSVKDPYQISLDDIMKSEEFSIDALARQMANGNSFGAKIDGR